MAKQVIDELRTQIEADKLRVGAGSQSRPDFDVSRTVVCEAIADLRTVGFVSPVQVKGVFVAHPKTQTRFSLTPIEVSTIPETLELLEFRMAQEGESCGNSPAAGQFS